MRASQRYEIVSEWRKLGTFAANERAPGDFDERNRIKIERFVADIKDTQGGHHYTEGAYKVVARNVTTGKVYHRQTTFYGETAWSDSRRLYEDLMNKVEYYKPA